MADETPGQMNSERQEQVFEGFVRILAWCLVTTIGVLIITAILGA